MRSTPLQTSLLVGLTLAGLAVARADFNPVPLTADSFNADVVVESTAPPTINNFVNATMDGGTNNRAWVWFEQGYNTNNPWTGLPVHGSTFTSATAGGHQFQMAPDYTANDVLCVFSNANNAGIPTGTLTLTTPAALGTLSFLAAGGGDSANTVTYTIHHSGGGTETGVFPLIRDWFNTGDGNIAWYASGRVNMDNGVLGNLAAPGAGSPRLFNYDITLSDQVNPVTAIDFSNTSGSRAVFFAVSGSTNALDYTPLAVTGFNRDMVIEATAPTPNTCFNATTVTIDNGTNNYANTFYETTLGGRNTSGLPHPGSNIVAGVHTWTMAPSYTNNDCAFVGNYAGLTSATLNLNIPAAYFALSFLNTSGNGPVPINVTVTHQAPGGTESFSFNSLDWFNGATAAYVANGRFQLENLAFNNVGGGACKLWANDIALADTTNPVASVTFTYNGTGGGRTAIFAVSGSTAQGGAFSPIGVSGYNADCIVEASANLVQPNIYQAVTASMDGGTNRNGNTWYAQGYYSVMPDTGLPAPGSTITSVAQTDHHYQLPASYTNNNAGYVDRFTTNINFAPLYPTNAYSALSFLNACANGSVTNQVIIQFQDGTAETNQFIGLDWFNDNVPYAFSSRGRVNDDNAAINNDPGRTTTPNPRLFEAQFFLANFNTPVTNITMTYQNPTNSNGREVVLAVSAAVGPVAPIISSIPTSLVVMEGSNFTFSAQVQGTLPITNQWQYSSDGGVTWVGLSDGGSFSGTTTPTLHISAGVSNTGAYRLQASNPVGTDYGATDTLLVYSGYPDITMPADAISPYEPNGGSSPGGEGVTAAIDDVVGNSSKYLNFGGNGGTPFLGPIGLIDTPAQGASIVKAIRIYTANDTQGRDPADYTLEGSNDGGNTWSPISANPLALPTGRNNSTNNVAPNPLTQFVQELDFYGNTSPYFTYRLSFLHSQNDSANNSIQIGEVELLGVLTSAPPVIVRQPLPAVTNYVGGSPTFGLAALGTPTPSYQWYRNNNPIAGATSATYTTNNVSLADDASTFTCLVTNIGGQVTSSGAVLYVIPAPGSGYESAILADHPVAYWPLSEGPDDGLGNQGVATIDYMGGHNGIYTNSLLGATGFNTNADPDTAATFGSWATVDSYAGNMQDLTFAAPSNTATATFSVEAWVLNSPSTVQTSDAGLVTKGFGGGGEQFNLDCGAADPAHYFRFFVRDAAGAVHSAAGTVGSTNAVGPFPNANAANMSWHHVVGVYDAPNSNVVLYVDGVQNAITVTRLTNGVLTSTRPVSIGARQSADGLPHNLQFAGTVEDVAIYNVALSSNQVLSHYFAAQPLPIFTVQPTNTTASEDGPVTLYSSAYGPPALTYQWYQSTNGGATFDALPGETNNTLSFVSTPLADNGYQYYNVADTGVQFIKLRVLHRSDHS